MADFVVQGLDDLLSDLATVAQMPEEVKDDILNAEADVLVLAQRRKVREYGIYDGSSPVHVADSIKKGRPKNHKDVRTIYITPKGTRTRGKEKKQKVRNAEILFINEFGKRGQRARPALADASAEAAEAMTAAGARVWDEYLKSNNF